MKSPKNYWYLRPESKSLDFQMSTMQRSNITTQINIKPAATAKQYQASINHLEKKAQKMEIAAQKILKIEDFYQLMCSGQYGNMAIRCYEHNNELILYCVNDHKLLCANCMYSSGYSTTNIPASPSNKKNLQNSKKIQTSKHTNHDVKQISKATMEITHDFTTWQHQYREQVNMMSLCKSQWEKLRQKYQEAKKNLFAQLDKQYDKLQMQLSKFYLDAKKELNDISEPYVEYLEKIINSYKTICKLVLPNRYPVPIVKQSWLYLMKKKIFGLISMRIEEIPSTWLKVYTSHSKVIIRKFSKRKVVLTEEN